jgi:alpha-tubulin suppressor-like RCC1 family protein
MRNNSQNVRSITISLLILLGLIFPAHTFAATPKIAAGAYYTAVIKSDGTLWAWGSNSSGQLGDGTTADKNVPT